MVDQNTHNELAKPLQILADDNIPNLPSLTSTWADINCMPGRAISAEHLINMDVLLVRSVTPVNQALLSGSNIKFVGSTTIGTDHIDLDYLQTHNIGFAYAPGCNANAVVDYVMSTMLSHYSDSELAQIVIGIVGHGNVGSRLARCCEHFKLNYRIYDPLIEQTANGLVASLDQLMQCDVLSLHVPLTRNGEHSSYHLFDHQRLLQFANASKKKSLLINSSRGAVVNNADLKALLQSGANLLAVLDVWEGEPAIDLELFRLCALGTAHIAGYSIDGKQRGATAVVSALKDYFAITQPSAAVPDELRRLTSFLSLKDYRQHLTQVYAVNEDAKRFAKVLSETQDEDQAAAFDSYRKHYPLRREINYD